MQFMCTYVCAREWLHVTNDPPEGAQGSLHVLNPLTLISKPLQPLQSLTLKEEEVRKIEEGVQKL